MWDGPWSMKNAGRHRIAFYPRFGDAALETRFRRWYRRTCREHLHVGFGFLVLFFMGVTAAQIRFTAAPLIANLAYAGMGALALAGFSVSCRRGAIRQPAWLQPVLVNAIVAAAVFGLYLPGSAPALQLGAAVVALLWFSLLSGTSIVRVFSTVGALAAVMAAVAVLAPSYARPSAALAALALAGAFAVLVAYLQERRLRQAFARRTAPAVQPVVERREAPAPTLTPRPGRELQALKELTVDLAGAGEAEVLYRRLLEHIKRNVKYDLAAVGRLQNGMMLPVKLNGRAVQGNGCNDSLQLLWRGQLIEQLAKTRAPLSGRAEAGLIQAGTHNGRPRAAHRLDIPFFGQGRLDGVVTLVRPRAFGEAESMLASSLVFHGLFAHRSARLQQQLERLQRIPREKPGEAAGPEKPAVLSVDEFLEQATAAFHRSRATGDPLSLLLVELDNHEHFLQHHGPGATARIFDALAGVLAEYMVPGGLLGRYGSGSFAMQLPVALAQAKVVAEKLRASARKQTLRVGRASINMTVSVGIAARDSSAPDFLSLLRGADIGLYLARDASGNSVRVQH